MTYGWIQTYSGKKFDVMKPDIRAISIIDISHALSNICRFTGHCKEFYSVAQHSNIVSDQFPTGSKEAMWGLMHDSAEAYIQDVARPVKQYLRTYIEMEERILELIARRFDLELPIPEEVLDMDDRVLMAEAEQLMRGDISEWYTVANPADVEINPLAPAEAEKQFLFRYFEILETIAEQEWTWKDHDQE